MLLSVIVPTRNRLSSLQKLIASFESASVPQGCEVEVLAVDNGSDDGTNLWLGAACQRKKRISLYSLSEKKPGKAHALNVGLAHAKGDVIMIIDDDVSAGPDLFLKHLEGYGSTSYQALQGRILPGKDPEGRPADFSRLREYNIPYIDYGDEFREIRGLTGTNMSFKREVFEKVGMFDTRLGPGAAGFSEDTEYSIRIRGAGFKIGYTPHAVVYHELNPNRYGRAYNRMVEYRKGLSRSIYRHDSIVFRVIPDLFATCLRYGVYRLLGKTQKAYKTEGRILKSWGYLNGKAQGVKTADTHSEV